jgi:hypothetical protein
MSSRTPEEFFPDPKKNRLPEMIITRPLLNFIWQTITGLTQCNVSLR